MLTPNPFLVTYRYASRCLLIEFKDPPILMTTAQHMNVVELWEKCSSCIGLCIELGDRFFNVGVHEVDDTLTPLLKSRADSGISPRVIPSYAILLWFAQQVYIYNTDGMKQQGSLYVWLTGNTTICIMYGCKSEIMECMVAKVKSWSLILVVSIHLY